MEGKKIEKSDLILFPILIFGDLIQAKAELHSRNENQLTLIYFENLYTYT